MRNLLLWLIFAFVADAAKIAVFVFPVSNSQVIFTNRVAEELARDHDVVIIRPNVNPKAGELVSNHPRVREIRTAGVSEESFHTYKELEKDYVWGNLVWYEVFHLSAAFRKMLDEMCTDFVADDTFMAKMREEKFDLALVQHIETCSISVAAAAGIPHYGYLLPTPLIRLFATFIGIPVLPSIYPSHLLDAGNEMTFTQRNKYGDDFPSCAQLVHKAKFLIVNMHPDIEFPVPMTSKVTYIGGLGMSNETKPLEEPYSSFISNANTVAFVSFGTVADPKIMPIEWKRAFAELFEKNPDVGFIWRMDESVDVPGNVLRALWHPQKDILGHKKVVAFITHAGYNSIGEAIASGTPLITVPLFGDQPRNSRLVEYRRFGVRVEKTNVTFEALNEALHKIMDEPSYSKSAQSLRTIAFSSPVSAGDALRHAVNFVLEHPDHNRDLPSLYFHQLYSLDMICLLGLIIVIFLYLCKLCFSCCRRVFTQSQQREKRKVN